MIKYSGIKYILDDLSINLNQVFAGFSFYGSDTADNTVLPDEWAYNSATGILNKNDNFYSYSGSGYFDGSTYMQLSGQKFLLENSFILLSYEKQRTGDEILLSSFTGNSFDTYSGFQLGINDANKLYLSYWNNVEGHFTLTYNNILSDKNLIFINKNGNVLSMGKYNNNTFEFEVEQFNIFQNVFIESDNLYLGGSPYRIPFNSNSLNFSGIVDKFFFIKSNDLFFYKNSLAVGLYSNLTTVISNGEQYCFETGYFSGSGFYYSGETNRFLSGFVTVTTGITGYQLINSGNTYYGLTGYENVSIGFFTDNCGVTEEVFTQNPLSGLITVTTSYNKPLTGFIYDSGFVEVIESGQLSGETPIWISEIYCTEGPIVPPAEETGIDLNYLSSLSYKEISLLKEFTSGSTIETFLEPYQNSILNYNKNLIYDELNKNYFYFENPILNKVLLFANGQLLIESGYRLESNGYNTEIYPSFDFLITGNRIETERLYDGNNYLFYDDIEIQNYYIFTGISNNILSGNFDENTFVFRNGQKLLHNIDYSYKGPLSTYPFNFAQKLSGDSAQDQFGYSVATNSDGTVIVMGGIGNDGGIGTASGAVLVFTGNSTVGWTQKQKLSGDSAQDQFGYSVATNSDSSIIVVGARADDPNGLSNAGAALVFTGNSAVGWTQVQKLSGDSAGDQFGESVAINGDGTVIVMGGPFDSPGGLTYAGSALVFTGNSTIGWRQAQKLSGDSVVDNFGFSVATNGDGTVIIMGGPSDDPNSLNAAGSALVFTGNSTIGWRQAQKLSGDSAQDQFGYSVATNSDGTVIVMGGIGNDGGTTIGSGAALVFTGNSTVGWTQKQKLSGDSANDRFGYSVATNSDGTIIMMGGIGNDGGTTLGSGAVLVFTGNSTVGWTQKQKLSGDSAQDQFGYSVATNGDGTLIVMGGIGNDGGTTTGSGAAMIFTAPKEVVLNNTNVYDNDDKFLLVEFNNNYNRSLNSGTGNTSTIKLNDNFNHGCSQIYLNGIRQKINNNYVENSNFDLISGTFYEKQNLNIIYNNTDDFLT